MKFAIGRVTNGSLCIRKSGWLPSRGLSHCHASCPDDFVTTTVGRRDIAVEQTGVRDQKAGRMWLEADLLGRVGLERGVT